MIKNFLDVIDFGHIYNIHNNCKNKLNKTLIQLKKLDIEQNKISK
jgi:hypothetical protein